jgi:hypothetical protein
MRGGGGRSARAIYQALYGPRNRQVAGVLRAQERGDSAVAKELFTQALAILETTAGPRHPEMASAPMRVVFLELRKGGDYASAEARLKRALAIHRVAVGSPSLAVAASAEALGSPRVW